MAEGRGGGDGEGEGRFGYFAAGSSPLPKRSPQEAMPLDSYREQTRGRACPMSEHTVDCGPSKPCTAVQEATSEP